MTFSAFLTHLAFASGLFALSALLTRLMLHRVRIMDLPNERSSHQAPTPKSGGISIVCTFLVGAAAIFFIGDKTRIREDYFIGFVFSAVLIAGISFFDDIRRRAFAAKLGTQLFSVVLVLAFGIVVDQLTFPRFGVVDLGWWGYPLTFLWIMGLTNAFNFMDGLDGLAAGAAVIVSAFFCAITFSQGSNFVYITCYALLAGSLGFLVFNFPPARIFMGDVGSAFLGFSFAVLAIIAARYDQSHTSFLVMPLLLFNFIYDTFFTFVRRLLRGERVLEAHRSHLYQLLNRTGRSHRFVTLFHYAVCIAQGIGAITMVGITGNQRMLVFLPFLVFQLIYTVVVMRRARAAGLL
jgi:UDP-GlcNAc:undecaprenyl-phosphate GlcNAc-1-phosphate transferase